MLQAIVIGALCCWRLTHLFNAEDGPGDILVRLRRRAGNGFFGSLLDCFYCLSLWIAAPLAWFLADAWSDRALVWLSISAGACLLERATDRTVPVPYFEEGGDHELLREGTSGGGRESGSA